MNDINWREELLDSAKFNKKEENLLRLRKNTQNKVLLFSMACSAVQILGGEKLWNGLKTSH